MSLQHWNYFLAIEQDVDNLSRYVEFSQSNFASYSIEIARILMTSTQEIDVLMKQICNHLGNNSKDEQGYCSFISGQFPKLPSIEVEVARYGLRFKPFCDWASNKTPIWWTANNKVKHQRHTHYNQASLENMLNSVCGLLIANLYYYEVVLSALDEIWPGSRLLYPHDMVENITPTAFGWKTNYKLP